MVKSKTSERGKVETIKLKKAISFNGVMITKAVIEIDHINYGMDPKTKILKKTKRTNFSVKDIERFLVLLDGEFLVPSSYKRSRSRFDIRIDCPVRGKFYQKEFIMVFDTDYISTEIIFTITLYPGWKK